MMQQHWASPRLSGVRSVGRAALAVLVIGWSGTLVAGAGQSDEGLPECGNSALAAVRFEPIRHDISTAALLGSDKAEVRWILSSEVTASSESSSQGTRYCYAYVFRNVGSTPVKVSLVSPRFAMSPLFEIMQDFSLVLRPGATETIRFSTVSAPQLALATAFNSARNEKMAKWAFVSSGPISLYLPAAVQASFTMYD